MLLLRQIEAAELFVAMNKSATNYAKSLVAVADTNHPFDAIGMPFLGGTNTVQPDSRSWISSPV